MRSRVIFLGPLMSLLVAASLSAQPAPLRIEGTYVVHNVAKPSQPGASITIQHQSGEDFSVVGNGLKGKGKLDGNTGYYDWTFSDGSRGRTAITVRADGTIEGHVQGHGPDGQAVDWSFIAQRTTAPQDSCVAPGQSGPRDDGFVYWTFTNSCKADRFVYVCAQYASGTTVRYGGSVPARGSADVSLGAASLGKAKLTWSEDANFPCYN